MALEAYLKEADASERTRMVLALMQYPRTKPLVDRDTPVLTVYYSCDEASRCSFDDAIKEIKENVDLKAYGATDAALTIIDEIKTHPDDFLPHKFDGFQLYRGGFDVLRLHRCDGKVPAAAGRMGFIEYNDMRAQAMEASSRRRQAGIEKAVVRAAESMSDKSCIIM